MSILQMDTARLWSSTNLAKILGLVRGRTRIQPESAWLSASPGWWET